MLTDEIITKYPCEKDNDADSGYSSAESGERELEKLETEQEKESSEQKKDSHELLKHALLLLNHNKPGFPQYRTPSVLGKVQAGNAKEHDYDSWHLTSDASVCPTRKIYASQFDPLIKQIDLVHVAGIELVSPILHLKEDMVWKPMLDQIFTDLTDI